MNAPPDTTTPGWRAVIAKIPGHRGNCHQAATTILEHAAELGLVDARVVGAEVQRGGDHWWVESDGWAYDFSNGARIALPVAEYRALGQVKDARPP